MPSLRPATPDDVPSSNNNDNNASSNKVRAVILTSDMKCQLRSIIPIKHQGRNRGVSEGDILCKVKGFIAACRGLSTVQVLMLNFPNEIEIIRVGGTDRFCLREIPPKNYFADERSEKSIEMESYPAYNIDRKGESCANKPLVSCMKHNADVVVKKEPGKEEHLVPKDGYADYTTTKARDHLTYDSSAPLDHSLSSVSNNSSERRVNKDVVRRDDSGKIPALSDDMIANILSILPSKDGKVRGTSISTIIENVQGFLDACNGKDFQQILEANLRGKIIIGSDSEGTKRYYTRDCLNANNISCSPSTSSTSCSRVQGYDTLQSSKKQLPNIVSITQDTTSAASVKSTGAANLSAQMKGRKGNSVEANIVKLLQEETKIKLSQFKQKYHTRFKKDLSHAGKLTNYLQQNPDVALTEPVSGKGKGKHTNDCYVILNRQIQSNTSRSNEKKTDATTNTRQVARETKASDTNLAASISTNDNGNTDQKQAVPVTKANTPHKIQDMLKLTDDQAQTCTKFPPGCRVVYDYHLKDDGHTFAEIWIGKVISVSISLSSTTKGQLKHEIKLNKGSMMVDEGNLAFAPQCLVYCQLEEEQEAAVVLSCQKDNSNTWQYSILVSRLDGDGEIVSLMLQNVSIDQLTHRESSSVVHDTTKQYTDLSVGGGSQSRNSKKRPNTAENGNCGIDNKRNKTG